jgi:Fic family protein
VISFRGNHFRNLALPAGTAWLMADIAESKGRQELHTRQAPQILRALRETALIQSTESSNRIEGVTVNPARLRPLVVGKARPRDRSEQEIQGYRRALHLIHTKVIALSITPGLIRRLHRISQEGAGDAGQYKKINNEIVELRPGAPPVVRFRPVEAADTLAAVEELCLGYSDALEEGRVAPLIATACLVLDFLCIHPFRDGNGRVSRLLTLLALYHHGFEVGRYISLERLVEESREDYYEVLRLSSQGWHDGRHDLIPWLNHFLTVLRRAYREFEERAGQVKSPRGAKRAMVEAAIEGRMGSFTLTELERECPGVSRDMVRRVLKDLRSAGRVVCLGRGPGASWRKEGNTLKRG